MAITLADFNKIWASTSPLTPYSFSKANYKQGWNFIGSTPPARQMWDFLQKQNDEKMQYIVNNYAPITNNAGCHNSVYCGKNLGTSVTAEQYAEISAGTFRDMFIGDYWVINGVTWRIAGFDYWFNTGDTNCITHHVVIVPDSKLASCKMNDTNITTGAYIGSDYYTGNNSNTGKATAQTAINNAFGAAHILSHREILANAVNSSGQASGWAWCDSTFELMNESMVCGHPVLGQSGYETGIDRGQLPLFALAPQYIGNLRENWWLRSVVSATYFAIVNYGGSAYYYGASGSFGVRPAFGIIG